MSPRGNFSTGGSELDRCSASKDRCRNAAEVEQALGVLLGPHPWGNFRLDLQELFARLFAFATRNRL